MSKTLKKDSRKIDKEEGKRPRTPSDLEIQDQRDLIRYDEYISDICPLPTTPYGCPIITELKSPEGGGLHIEFTDWNSKRERYLDSEDENDTADVRLLINTGFNENATNRTLACLCFFQWDGQNYNQVSLSKEGHDDLKYVVIGNIIEAHVDLRGQEEWSLSERIELGLQEEKEVKG